VKNGAHSLKLNATKWIAYSAALGVLVFNLTLAVQSMPMVPFGDGWGILNRIMHFDFGELSWDQYLFRPHGAHLHSIVFLIAWLDFHFAGGQQELMRILSLGATSLFSAFFVVLLIREGLRSRTPMPVVALATATTVAILTGIADYETMLHPFQVVLSVARLSYIVLLWVLIIALIDQKRWIYFISIALSMLAVSFHGSGYIFAICVILAHVLACRNRWWMAVCLLPLLACIIIQTHYSQGGTELTQLSSIINKRALLAFPPAVFAYFASPLWLLYSKIGGPAILLIGFVLFSITITLTVIAVIKVLGLRSWSPSTLWEEIVRSRIGKQPEKELVLFSILGMFIMLTSVAAALFWIVRTNAPGLDRLPYLYILHSGRYGAYAGLAYVMFIAAILRFTGRAIKGTAWLNEGLGTVILILLLLVAVWSSRRESMSYDNDDRLHIAVAGISLGMSPTQSEVEAVWPGANKDGYWATELPLTVTHYRAEYKGVWNNLPTLGAKGGAFYAGHLINNVKRLAVATDTNPGRCGFSGTISAEAGNYRKLSLLLPVATSDGTINGYAALTRQSSGQPDRLVKGFVLCPKGAGENTPLFLAHDIQATPPQNITFDSRSIGMRAIVPLSDMKGNLLCALESKRRTAVLSDTLVLTIRNNSDFDWKLGVGKFPLRVGVHLYNLDGTLLRGDDGFRVPTDAYITSNGSVEIRFPLDGLSLKGIAEGQREVAAEFGLVQDGHAWFSGLSCKMVLRK